MNKSVHVQWESFSRDFLPPAVSRAHIRRSRLAFYAGFSAALAIVRSLGEDEVSEAEALAVMARLHEEVGRFIEQAPEASA